MRLLFLCLAAICVATVTAAAPAFDPKPWIADLAQTRAALLAKYANIEWVVEQHEVDLAALFADTQMRLQHAGSDAEARAAFDRLARKIGDEHLGFRWPKDGPEATASPDRCVALGYDAHSRGALLAAEAEGYRPLANAQADEFPAGLLTVNGTSIGVIKIGVFMPQGYPALCNEAVRALSVPPDKPCDDACNDRIDSWVSDRLTHDFATQLSALKDAGATTLVIDIAGNGGGTEWSEAVARMVTPIRLKAEELRFVRGEHWTKRFSDDEAELRGDAQKAKGADRALLLSLADQIEARKREALAPCDVSPLWSGERPACSWLGKGFYATGLLASADPAALRGKPWAPLLFSPMEFPYAEGVWRGPLIVLMDRGVGSAASEFAAELQDNRAAVLMGEPSGGGCGHTDGGTPTILQNSKAVLSVPDCARFRADGTNEAMGIQPDVLVGFMAEDGPHLQAKRFLAHLPEALDRASRLAGAH